MRSTARTSDELETPLVAAFSTEGVHKNERFASWREQLGPRFGVAEVTRATTGPFSASIETFSLGKLALSDISADALTFERTRRHIGHRARDEFTVGILVSGSGVAEQDGRSANLEAGDLVLCDGRRPNRLRFDAPFRQLVFHCDRAQLEARLPDADRRTATRVEGRAELPAATANYLASIARQARQVGAAECVVAQHALDLIALAIVGRDASSPSSGLLLARVHAFVEDNLSDPDLSPAMIARQHGISRRNLYRLFDETGDSVAAFIRRRRLARCRAELADERQAKRGISEIAFAWGFNDSSSFGRAFRDAFGVTPREYRRSTSKRWVP